MSLTPIGEQLNSSELNSVQTSVDLPTPWEQYWDVCNTLEISERGNFQIYKAGESGPVLFLVHGGGYTGRSWSLLAAKLKHEFRIFAVDLRGHGETSTINDLDLSIETLIADLKAVLIGLGFGCGDTDDPVVLVGHSMGGAIVVKAAAEECNPSIKGVIVLDVVEGTALASLPFMKNVIQKRPASFTDLDSAVKWALTTKMSRNQEAARISIPSMLIQGQEGWIWKTPLMKSEQYWTGWYTNLSEIFLKLSIPKLLCLAGTDRLDKTLTVGQMQGKFQLALLPTAGHAIHEDDPEKVAHFLTQFIHKFRIGQEALPFLKNTQEL